jgi:hypothetical protein
VPSNELAVLKYLNSDELRADEANATVPVLEFIEYGVWTFAVTPHWTDSTSPEFTNIGEVCDWALQFIKVSDYLNLTEVSCLTFSSLQAIAFIHCTFSQQPFFLCFFKNHFNKYINILQGHLP